MAMKSPRARIRNQKPELMVKAFELVGLSEEHDVEQRFGGMYRAFQYGAPPHGGMAAGVDRIVMLVCGAQNLARDHAVPDEPARRGPADGGAFTGQNHANCANCIYAPWS